MCGVLSLLISGIWQGISRGSTKLHPWLHCSIRLTEIIDLDFLGVFLACLGLGIVAPRLGSRLGRLLFIYNIL